MHSPTTRFPRLVLLTLAVTLLPCGPAGSQDQTPTRQEGARLEKLANAAANQGRFPEAEGLYRRVYAIARQVLGEQDPDLGTISYWIGQTLVPQGRIAEAETEFRAAAGIRGRALGPDRSVVLSRAR